jgi:CRP/FNR family transcriptional regulator, anaerobic regulatory protein
LPSAPSTRLPQLKARLLDGDRELSGALEDLLPRRLQIKLKHIATELEFRRGECDIACQGGNARFVYLIDTGIVRVSRLSPAGRRQVLTFIFSGGIFGLPDGGCYANSAQVIGPATLHQIPWEPFKNLMQEEPDLNSALLTRVAFDFRQAQRRIVVLSQQNASQKLASFLLDLRDYAEFRDKRKGYVRLSLSRSDLGDYLGIAPETLARALARMEEAGILRRKSGRLLHVADMAMLRQIACGPRRAPAREKFKKTALVPPRLNRDRPSRLP